MHGLSAGARSDLPTTRQAAGGGDGEEPNDVIGAEERRDARRAVRLHREQADQDDHRQRQHIWVQGAGRDLSPSTADSTESAGVISASP